jgi:hypothetical protein
MKTNKKIPDLVVWDEEKGYYARELTYGSNIGAPAIEISNVSTWRQNKVKEVNNQFKAKYEELKAEAEKLINEYNWNELIYSKVQYNFQPTVGEIHHLYIRKNESIFLSIIDPKSWNQNHIASFKLDSNNKWIKI